MRDVIVRRREITNYIAEEPWTATVHRRPVRQGDSEITFSFTCRVAPVVLENQGERSPSAQPSEEAIGQARWLIVSAYDTTLMKTGDVVTVVCDTVTRLLRVIVCDQYSYKVIAHAIEAK
jgi:hypothetical protein